MKQAQPVIEQLTVLGVGLIGGSLARALKQAGAVRRVCGWGRNQATLDQALELEVLDAASIDLAEAVQGAEVVVIATPVGAMGEMFTRLAKVLDATSIITDVGSVKGSVVEAARQSLGPAFARFVPGHPIAGTEKSGVEASFAELFQHRRLILTPVEETDARAVALVQRLWEAAGSEVIRLTPDDHDAILAATSHLPHVLAYALVELLGGTEEKRRMFSFAAGGFHDFTRIASSDPLMWRDICVANQKELALAVRQYRDALNEVLQAIEKSDTAWLMDMFARAKLARDTLLPADARFSSPE
jgi:prephenate dehydrogenase